MIAEDGKVPIIIEAAIGSTKFRVPLDSLAMENIISLDFLKEVAPEARLGRPKFVLRGFMDCKIKPKGVW